MSNSKTKHLLRLSAFSALVASSVAIPAMAELKEECLFKGEILQKQADTPLQIRFTGIDDGENARCRAALGCSLDNSIQSVAGYSGAARGVRGPLPLSAIERRGRPVGVGLSSGSRIAQRLAIKQPA